MDLTDIEEEISRLEANPDSYLKLERLNLLCQIRDRYAPRSTYSRASAPTSDFGVLAASVPVDGLISVMEKHMAAIKEIYPKEYESIMRQLRQL